MWVKEVLPMGVGIDYETRGQPHHNSYTHLPLIIFLLIYSLIVEGREGDSEEVNW